MKRSDKRAHRKKVKLPLHPLAKKFAAGDTVYFENKDGTVLSGTIKSIDDLMGIADVNRSGSAAITFVRLEGLSKTSRKVTPYSRLKPIFP